MLNKKSNGLRFSREYASLILRYAHQNKEGNPCSESYNDSDTFILNHIAQSFLKNNIHSGFGLSVGPRLHLSDFGAVGYAAMNCSNILDAIKTTVRYRGLICRGLNISLSPHEEGYLYEIHMDDESPLAFPLVEFELTSSIRFANLATNASNCQRIKIKHVMLKHAPLSPKNLYEKAFGCAPEFNASCNAILIDSECLSQPTHNPNPALFHILDNKLREAVALANAHVQFADRVRAYVASATGRFPYQEDVAKHFCLSVSGLKAKLRRDGVSFRDILDEERFKAAEKQLTQGQQSIKQISFDLGFSDQSAFNRAFKRWSGTSPKAFRLGELTSRAS